MPRKKKKKIQFRSKFEERVAENLNSRKIPFKYEDVKLEYTVPSVKRKYTPDFSIGEMLIEVKGLFDYDSRMKMLLVKEQHPDRDIRLLFMRDQPIRKGSETRYSDWCTTHGFKFAFKELPKEWLK
jgi:hypothetical protein